MRRIVLHMMMSLDGFVASATDESWMVPDKERDAVTLGIAQQADLSLIGHGVYHDMVAYWPTAEGETETQRAHIARINAMPKLVVTQADPGDLEWNAEAYEVADGKLAERIHELKRSDGGDIVLWGGAHLVQALAGLDLIDEYQLIIQPVALVDGVPLFSGGDGWRRLRLLESRGFRTGAVFVRYVLDRSHEHDHND